MQNVPCLSSFRSYESRHAPKWGYFSSLSFIFNVSIPINSSLPGRWDEFGEVVLPGLGRSSRFPLAGWSSHSGEPRTSLLQLGL